MKDSSLNRRLAQQQADALKLLWIADLLSPSKTGMCFTKDGLRVLVSGENIDSARALFAQGARDIQFTAHRVDGFSANEAHFTLDFFEVVR